MFLTNSPSTHSSVALLESQLFSKNKTTKFILCFLTCATEQRTSYLKSPDDEQGVDVVDPHLLGNFVQMFSGESSKTKVKRFSHRLRPTASP